MASYLEGVVKERKDCVVSWSQADRVGHLCVL